MKQQKLIVINQYKTDQICSNYGYDDRKHKLEMRYWICLKCHTKYDKDIITSKIALITFYYIHQINKVEGVLKSLFTIRSLPLNGYKTQ
ncbi:zinc ribbon domain-containing protein [Companilactobacillus mindensis]|uniref:zinc ribbon domain-containing protein n=1 Tax=Companilactobacillus mindensis TaxID=167481 RepID=UPI001191B06A|nr:hypothetical protein LMI01_12830 [Companilactobacillus mindensis]